MSIEAMKLALEALEALIYNKPFDGRFGWVLGNLRQAIAEAEKQEPVAWLYQIKPNDNKAVSLQMMQAINHEHVREMPLYTHPQPKQEQEQGEPVAWMYEFYADRGHFGLDFEPQSSAYNTPLYTTPQPAQKPWVGLTDEEANQLWESTDSDWELMKRTEAKLKEKNNG